MRIIHIDETFHPSYGYQANPLAKFQRLLGNEVIIVTVEKKWVYPVYREFGDDLSTLKEEDSLYETTTGVKIIRVPAFGYLMGRLVYKKQIFRVVNDLKPDVLFVHCVETLTAIRFLYKNRRFPMMFDSHMLAMASRNPFSKAFEYVFMHTCAKRINNKGLYVIRAQDDSYVNKHLGIKEELTPFISFGTDTLLFSPSSEARSKFRTDNSIDENDFVVLYTGKLTEAKGGMFLAKSILEEFKGMNLVFVCVGTPPNDSYGKQVKELLQSSRNRVLLFPTQKYTSLAPFYQAADLSIFPKQCSMSFYDAQACGLPVLSEDNNVNVDRCSHGNGFNFKSGDIEDFRQKIKYVASLSKDEYNAIRENARGFISTGYSYDTIAREYLDYLKKSIENFQRQSC